MHHASKIFYGFGVRPFVILARDNIAARIVLHSDGSSLARPSGGIVSQPDRSAGTAYRADARSETGPAVADLLGKARPPVPVYWA